MRIYKWLQGNSGLFKMFSCLFASLEITKTGLDHRHNCYVGWDEALQAKNMDVCLH